MVCERCAAALLCLIALQIGSASGAVVNILPYGSVEVYPDDFDGDDKACTGAHLLRASFNEFALDANATKVTFFYRGSIDCAASTLGFVQRAALFAFGAVDVLVDCSTQSLILNGGALGRVLFALPPASTLASLEFVLVIDPAQPATLCVGGATVQGTSVMGSGLLEYLGSSRALLATGVQLGARSAAWRSARATFAEFWLETGGRQACPQDWGRLAAAAAANHAPAVAAVAQQPGGEVAVGDAVRFEATATDGDGDTLRLRITFFGVPPEGCRAAECGDKWVEASGAGGRAWADCTLAFPRPGRFVVRLQAADGSGAVATHDHFVLVRKLGDAQQRAPCCRHAPYIVAGAIGRPIDHTVFRAPSVYQAGQQLGWGGEQYKQYMDGFDLEAERLFDYSALAPRADGGALRALSCADARLAGAGSPPVWGLRDAARADAAGHNKALAVVPLAFAWARASGDVECQRHWSGWQEASPYRRTAADGAACSVACTKAGTEALIRETGMFDQYNQALIANSFGALSLSPAVTVLDEVHVGPDPLLPTDDNYQYYEAPARQALAAKSIQSWMYLVLSPLSLRRPPTSRAFSGGPASGGAVVSSCFASMYYAVHETGHRIGFRHANVYRLAQAQAAPADPLGPGSFKADSYDDRLDAMSCCKSDFGLYHRTLAGWLRGSGRLVVGAADMQRPATRRLVLWPFDRPESRGRQVSVALRRSPGEVLLLGLRSAGHWQDAGSGGLPPEEARQNVAGLQVEYVRREAGGWSERGLLDFNVLHGDWPDALPNAPGAAPRRSQFALLKEGYSWYDSGSQLAVSLERLAECDGPAGLRPYSHSAPSFYGFRGEWPFQERFAQANYSGYAEMRCAVVMVRTAAPSPPAAPLDISLSVADAASGVAPSTASGRAAGSCSAQRAAALAISWPPGVEVSSVVWRDALNSTLLAQPVSPGQASAALPAAVLLPASVTVLAADGRHSRAEALPADGGGQVTVQYKYYQPGALTYRREVVAHGPPACVPGQAAGEDVTGLLVGISVLSAAVAVAAVVLGMLTWQWCAQRRQRSARRGEGQEKQSTATELLTTKLGASLIGLDNDREK